MLTPLNEGRVVLDNLKNPSYQTQPYICNEFGFSTSRRKLKGNLVKIKNYPRSCKAKPQGLTSIKPLYKNGKVK